MNNQVDPRGDRYASAGARHATLTGNQGVASRIAHLSCDLDPKWRRGRAYQRLFFLDEPTALAYGHRPCNRCRRAELRAFQRAWDAAGLGATNVGSIDEVLHGQRGTIHRAVAADLPAGTMIDLDGEPHLVTSGSARRWSPSGYLRERPLPDDEVEVITPPAIVAVLGTGYRPAMHPTSGA